jgi:hypothetical protein
VTDSPSLVWLNALSSLLRELTEGPSPKGGYVLNPGDRGLFGSLEQLSAEAASARGPNGGASIAAHVDHLCYGFGLMNRWRGGEENPFAGSDFAASWDRIVVTEPEWRRLRDRLRQEVAAWRDAMVAPLPPEPDSVTLEGIISSVVHFAYHVGAIRQINRSVGGPQAQD